MAAQNACSLLEVVSALPRALVRLRPSSTLEILRQRRLGHAFLPKRDDSVANLSFLAGLCTECMSLSTVSGFYIND